MKKMSCEYIPQLKIQYSNILLRNNILEVNYKYQFLISSKYEPTLFGNIYSLRFEYCPVDYCKFIFKRPFGSKLKHALSFLKSYELSYKCIHLNFLTN